MLEYSIICPYCFKRFGHTEVHFRSERFYTGECDAIPQGYDDIHEIETKYKGPDKEKILEKCREWEFFLEGDDVQYERFWNDERDGFGGTTEHNSADSRLGILAYQRKVLRPSEPEHQKYLKEQASGDFLLYDRDGFVYAVELTSGEICARRVCPHCHNPLPEQYGKHPVKFITVMGITGAGKTVYLSQLIKNLKNYAAKVGLAAITTTPSAREFLQNNQVKVGEDLPGSTAANRLQQPIFYDLVRSTSLGTKKTNTFVIYDVAGENCLDAQLLRRFARFIENADGIFLLIDPKQFQAIESVSEDSAGEAVGPTAVLDAIYNLVSQGDAGSKCAIPLAVCISKSDLYQVQEVLDLELCSRILDEVRTLRDRAGHGLPRFVASDYNEIARGLKDFMVNQEEALEQQLYSYYSTYNYFAFTALGCEVIEGKPVGPLLPKRIEEPLLWLFYQFGYIDTDREVFSPAQEMVICPICRSGNVEKLEGEDSWVTERVGLFRRPQQYKVEHGCRDCGHKW